MAVVIYGNTEVEVDGARWRDGDVWVPVSDLPAATGWEVKPEGVCAGETCVPAPPDASWADGDAFNLSAFARHVGVAEAADPDQELVAFVPDDRSGASASIAAPDFTLPDLDGRMHSLSDYRGQKVVLLTWASF
jgi:AhpC/TSA family